MKSDEESNSTNAHVHRLALLSERNTRSMKDQQPEQPTLADQDGQETSTPQEQIDNAKTNETPDIIERADIQEFTAIDRLITEKALLDLIDQQTSDEAPYLQLARSFDEQDNYEGLEQVASYVLRLNPSSAPALAWKARALQKLNRLSEATIANDQALLLDTNLPQAWLNRGGLQLLQQKFNEALRSTQRAVELDPQNARAWANRGVALLNFERFNEALEAFSNSLRCDPHMMLALQMKGDILCRLGRMREVIPVARQALTINPSDITALTQAAQALRAMEQYEALVDVTQELIKQTPDSLFAWDNYIRGLRGKGDFVTANDALDHALQLDPGDVRFLTFKADTLYRLQRYREAASIAQRALKLAPDYPPLRRIHEKAIKLMYQRKGTP